jgi:prepilin-type N-terminal cleavage/methylation domain-containing protein
MRHRKGEGGGHTLPEVLVALAICAALAAVGVASWQGLARPGPHC